MKPHIRKVRGIWTVRMCVRAKPGELWSGGSPRVIYVHGIPGPIGHGYTFREACEDWKAQMQAQRA